MPRHSHIRSELHATKLIQPEFGARHPIAYTEDIDVFFTEMHDKLNQAIVQELPESTEPFSQEQDQLNLNDLEAHVDYLLSDERDLNDEQASLLPAKRPKRLFRVYDDPDRVGVSVLERRLPRMYAQRNRIKWTKNDVGRIQGEIQNELARMSLAGQPLSATFTDVQRLGDADEDKARKLALVLDPESEISDFMVQEHAIVINGITGTLKRFRHPYSDFIPHWTVARVNREAGQANMSKAVAAIRSLLPLTVQLQRIHLFSEQDLVIDDY
jgi:hypothetical protein